VNAGTTSGERVVAFSGVTPIDGAEVLSTAAREPRFAEVLDACDAIVVEEGGWSPLGKLAAGGGALLDLRYCFALNVMVHAASFALLRARGLAASSALGLSAGEVSAALAAGAITLREAMRISLHGGRVIKPIADARRMALVWLSARRCAELLSDAAGVGVAAVMEPGVTTLAGEVGALNAVLARLAAEGVRVHRVNLPWGAHTRQFEPLRAEFTAAVGRISPRPSERRLVLAACGGTAEVPLDTRYWFDMIGAPVHFLGAVQALVRGGAKLFVEAGPESAVTHLIPRLGARSLSFRDTLARAWGGEA
jgi:acyl transferase domain-containing protein